MEATGDVRADALAARALSDRRDPGERVENRSQEHPVRKDADRIPGLRSDRDRSGWDRAAAAHIRAKIRRARVLRSISGLRAGTRHDRMDQGGRGWTDDSRRSD